MRNRLPKEGNEDLFSTAMRLEKDLEIGKDGDDESLPILARISDVAIDSKGRIYVAEAAQSMVLVYENNGSFINQIGREGEGPGEFRWLEAIAFERKRALWGRPARCIHLRFFRNICFAL